MSENVSNGLEEHTEQTGVSTYTYLRVFISVSFQNPLAAMPATEAKNRYTIFWKLKVCIAVIIIIFTVITTSVSIAAMTVIWDVQKANQGINAALEPTRVIVDALSSWDTPLGTAIEVVDST